MIIQCAIHIYVCSPQCTSKYATPHLKFYDIIASQASPPKLCNTTNLLTFQVLVMLGAH